ncbi:hypothetical protein DOY81_014942 [Sarcophaga bullata]|nr:hypothetical protein DOY81_014942 [Sarcophaga bullata]
MLLNSLLTSPSDLVLTRRAASKRLRTSEGFPSSGFDWTDNLQTNDNCDAVIIRSHFGTPGYALKICLDYVFIFMYTV